jgi:hypothetical protein
MATEAEWDVQVDGFDIELVRRLVSPVLWVGETPTYMM